MHVFQKSRCLDIKLFQFLEVLPKLSSLRSCWNRAGSFCWKMGWALDRFSGFLIAPSPSASTSQISFYASKKPIGQKCCVSCLDQFTEFVYLRCRLILNQFATDAKIRSPQAPVSDPMAD